MRTIGYEPTYEGLKLELHKFYLWDIFGYEPTYEGLKLVNDRKGAGRSGVTSLPMRD